MKTTKLLLIALGLSLTFTACTPAEVQTWFTIQTDGEVELTAAEARAVSDWIITENAKKARLTPTVPRVLVAISSCESGNGRYGVFSYSAKNSRSTASGRYQFLNSTWRYVSRSYASTWKAHGWESLRQEATRRSVPCARLGPPSRTQPPSCCSNAKAPGPGTPPAVAGVAGPDGLTEARTRT